MTDLKKNPNGADPASLATLPTEIILDIVLRVPHNLLPALDLVSRRLHQCVMPQLYRFVHFIERDTSKHSQDRNVHYPAWQSLPLCSVATCNDVLRRDTKILQLPLFLRTIAASESLRRLVVGASFDWVSSSISGVGDIIVKVLQFLEPSLLFLHLSPSPSTPNFASPAFTTSLHVGWRDLPYHTGKDDTYEDFMYQLFCKPSLRHLSFSRVNKWIGFHQKGPENRCRTSTVTSLSFLDCMPPANSFPFFISDINYTGYIYKRKKNTDLARILSWPIALTSFHFRVCSVFPTWTWRSTLTKSPKRFITALRNQCESLEELFITYTCGSRGVDGTTFGRLTSFTSLKRLGLPRDLLILSKRDIESRFGSVGNQPELHEVLPQTIEEIQIEVLFQFEWNLYFAKNNIPGEMREDAGELSGWLTDVALHKTSHYPSLKRVIIWQRDNRDSLKRSFNLEDLPECSDLLSVFKAASINLSWVRSQEAPLFSA